MLSLVAYTGSDSEDEGDQPAATGKVGSRETLTASVEQTPTETAEVLPVTGALSGEISGSEDEADPFDVPAAAKAGGEYHDIPLFSVLPSPSTGAVLPTGGFTAEIEEDELEDFVKKKEIPDTEVEEQKKQLKKKKRLVLPSLSSHADSDSDDESSGGQKPIPIRGPSGKKSVLLSLLPPPKHASSLLPPPKHASSLAKGKEPGQPPAAAPPRSASTTTTTTRSLVPLSVSKRRATAPAGKGPLPKKNPAHHAGDSSDSDDEGASGGGFFSLDKQEEKIEPIFEPLPDELPLPNPQALTSVNYEAAEASSSQSECSGDAAEASTSSTLELDEVALAALQGRRFGRKGAPAGVVIKDVSADSILPGPEALLKQLSEEKQGGSYANSSKFSKGFSGREKSRHQITYLAAQAKARDLELRNNWAEARINRKTAASNDTLESCGPMAATTSSSSGPEPHPDDTIASNTSSTVPTDLTLASASSSTSAEIRRMLQPVQTRSMARLQESKRRLAKETKVLRLRTAQKEMENQAALRTEARKRQELEDELERARIQIQVLNTRLSNQTAVAALSVPLKSLPEAGSASVERVHSLLMEETNLLVRKQNKVAEHERRLQEEEISAKKNLIQIVENPSLLDSLRQSDADIEQLPLPEVAKIRVGMLSQSLRKELAASKRRCEQLERGHQQLRDQVEQLQAKKSTLERELKCTETARAEAAAEVSRYQSIFGNETLNLTEFERGQDAVVRGSQDVMEQAARLEKEAEKAGEAVEKVKLLEADKSFLRTQLDRECSRTREWRLKWEAVQEDLEHLKGSLAEKELNWEEEKSAMKRDWEKRLQEHLSDLQTDVQKETGRFKSAARSEMNRLEVELDSELRKRRAAEDRETKVREQHDRILADYQILAHQSMSLEADLKFRSLEVNRLETARDQDNEILEELKLENERLRQKIEASAIWCVPLDGAAGIISEELRSLAKVSRQAASPQHAKQEGRKEETQPMGQRNILEFEKTTSALVTSIQEKEAKLAAMAERLHEKDRIIRQKEDEIWKLSREIDSLKSESRLREDMYRASEEARLSAVAALDRNFKATQHSVPGGRRRPSWVDAVSDSSSSSDDARNPRLALKKSQQGVRRPLVRTKDAACSPPSSLAEGAGPDNDTDAWPRECRVMGVEPDPQNPDRLRIRREVIRILDDVEARNKRDSFNQTDLEKKIREKLQLLGAAGE
ncbi:unnamed protein product [Cyprideis torosa]|uniref:Uncharacterized protein n=1 Tax=Cyprideis torosa TaxID=163714 RepID=A0A7R8WI72_9CRUS|nr:unnamed protein product [Cyprideis torosa]CAG0893784.1 unnamed protein product [Cyprideis torosa]